MLANPPIIDTNIDLGRWPMRRTPLDNTEQLVAELHAQGVVEAWAGSFDGLFHEDLRQVNDRLAETCNAHTLVRLVPFGEINPLLPGWQRELTRCAEKHRMPGIRLHPNYHGYDLNQPTFAEVLKLASELGLVVALVLVMEDERMMHPLLRVPVVDVAPLPRLLEQAPGVRVLLVNGLRHLRGDALFRLMHAGNVCVEISMLEGTGGLEKLVAEVPPERVLFGSHAPSFYFESSRLKLAESKLSASQRAAIFATNARQLLSSE